MEELHVTTANRFDVGARLRALREARGWSLRTLAENCSLSVNAISLIERGRSSPTVASLLLLAEALDVPIAEFFHEDDHVGAVFVEREHRPTQVKNGVSMESLAPGMRNQQLEPFLFTLEPGSGNEELVRHPGQEFAFCLAGRVEYCVEGTTFPLDSGDSLLLEATRAHRFRNVGSATAKVLVVFQASSDPDAGRRRHL